MRGNNRQWQRPAMTAGRPPVPFQGQRERMFMITGIGVHDQPDYAFKITGIRIQSAGECPRCKHPHVER